MQTTRPCINSDVSCKQSTLVRNEILFNQTNLSEACIDKDFSYGFLAGTKEQNKELIAQFSSLNSHVLSAQKQISGEDLGNHPNMVC